MLRAVSDAGRSSGASSPPSARGRSPTAAPDPQADPHLGKSLAGRYRVERLIARGGMARVYRGRQTPIDRPVAIKILTSKMQGVDPHFQRRFLLEAATAAHLNHPNIVTVHDYGEGEGGELFMIMELLPGETLQRALSRREPFPPERILHVAVQIARALREAHAKGVVHRDLKPGNVMLAPDADGEGDYVKVLDFGLVKLFDGAVPAALGEPDEDERDLTQAGTLLGSPRYMSPEQIRLEPLDPRTDVYSLGVILYHMVAGQPPFSGRSGVDTMNLHLNEAPPPLGPDRCPPELAGIIQRCLEKDREHRFESMSELVVALKDAARLITGASYATDTRLPVPALASAPPRLGSSRSERPGPGAELDASDSLATPRVAAFADPSMEPADSSRPLAPPRSSRLPLAVTALALLVALLTLYVAWQVRRSPPEPVTIPTPAFTEVNVTSTPPGAAVLDQGRLLGITPARLRLDRQSLGARQVLELRLDGYRPARVEVAIDTAVTAAHASLAALPPPEPVAPPEPPSEPELDPEPEARPRRPAVRRPAPERRPTAERRPSPAPRPDVSTPVAVTPTPRPAAAPAPTSPAAAPGPAVVDDVVAPIVTDTEIPTVD